MAEVQINSFFTRGGIPATDIDDLNPHSDGLNYPRIRIWDVTDLTKTLIIGSPTGTGQNTDGVMQRVNDGSVEDGFYYFNFTDVIGYNENRRYLVRCDGGPSLGPGERYQVVRIDPQQLSLVDIGAIADGIWDEPVADHNTIGSTGLALAQTKANTEQLVLTLNDVKSLIDILLKYETNRTKIDTNTQELIIFDDDCTTVLRKFKLYNSNGQPSVDEVCERVPTSATDGLPTC